MDKFQKYSHYPYFAYSNLRDYDPQRGDLVMVTPRISNLDPPDALVSKLIPVFPSFKTNCSLIRENYMAIFEKFLKKDEHSSVFLSPSANIISLDEIILSGGSAFPCFKFRQVQEYSKKGSQKLFVMDLLYYCFGNDNRWIVGKKNILDYLSDPVLDIFVPFIERIEAT